MIDTSPNSNSWMLLFLAFAVALVASLGVLFIGEVIGQAPCNLCWFQRAFIFPLAIVLAVATFRSDAAIWIYAVPLAAAGWPIAQRAGSLSCHISSFIRHHLISVFYRRRRSPVSRHPSKSEDAIVRACAVDCRAARLELKRRLNHDDRR